MEVIRVKINLCFYAESKLDIMPNHVLGVIIIDNIRSIYGEEGLIAYCMERLVPLCMYKGERTVYNHGRWKLVTHLSYLIDRPTNPMLLRIKEREIEEVMSVHIMDENVGQLYFKLELQQSDFNFLKHKLDPAIKAEGEPPKKVTLI
ncbi:beta protein [Adelaide River virus]|uniref:Protein beta n=2 Tax=Adelaide River virus TaxID=31612 RepID=VPB_ARV|nr:beta protein [Adelaide River virus]Q65109.1 RecName: Full=Protein beta [Adelaide River virus]AAA50193.1 beta protein [Adelaide River virus]AFR23539.1 beta protein [Adelaide River virus]